MKKTAFSVHTDGFTGTLFCPENHDDRAVIVLQGLKGLELPEKYAQLFAQKGYSALAMTYYGAEGLPKKMGAMPLDMFESAVKKLRESGFKRIGIYGNSKGAGMALLAAAYVPEISLVIAASPFGHIFQGSGKNVCRSMVKFHEKELPYVSNKGLFVGFCKRCIRERGIKLLYLFDEWESMGSSDNEIPVERINGSILFLTSTHDDSVPAKKNAEQMIGRLERLGFKHKYRHINFETGSHNLGIFPVNNNLLAWEKKHPAECDAARKKALNIILRTLDKWDV